MKMHPLRVAMPPHGLIFGANEAYGLQDAFGSVPGPPRPQKLAKNAKNYPKPETNDFCRFLVPIFPLKDALGFVFSLSDPLEEVQYDIKIVEIQGASICQYIQLPFKGYQ